MLEENKIALVKTKRDLIGMRFTVYANKGVAVAVDETEIYVSFEEVKYMCTGNVVIELIKKAYHQGADETKKLLKEKALCFFD